VGDPVHNEQDTAERAQSRSNAYVVIARRYRPQSFEELVGQEHVAEALRNAISGQRVGHAYLFTGARGVGKTSAARILAKALNCRKGPTPTPCNQCDICRRIGLGEDMDVLEIDGASNRGIDEIRQLRENVGIRPSRARFKLYIIDEVHMLTREAFNALLKTLEEPPPHVKFIFCTTEPTRLPVTIVSRCQRFDFAGISNEAIVRRLGQIVEAEGVEAEPEALRLLAHRAGGSMRDSQSLLEQLLAFSGERIRVADVHRLLGTADEERLARLGGFLSERDAAAALGELDAAVAEGADPALVVEQLFGFFRDLMVAAAGCKGEAFLFASPERYEQLAAAARRWGLTNLLAVMQILEQTLGRMRFSTQVRVLAELALVRICQLEDLEELACLIDRLRTEGLPAGASAAGGPGAGPAGQRSGRPPRTPSASSGGAAARGSGIASSGGTGRGLPETAETAETAPPAAAGAHSAATQTDSAPAAETTGKTGKHAAQTSADSGAPTGADPAEMAENGESAAEAGGVATQVGADGGDTGADSADKGPPDAVETWHAALERLTGMVVEHARKFHRAQWAGPGRLVIGFEPRYAVAKSYCQRPEQTRRLEESLGEVVGRPVRVEFVAEEATVADQPAQRRAVSPHQQLLQVAKHPLIQRAGELFGGQPVRIDQPPEKE